MGLDTQLRQCRERAERALDRWLPTADIEPSVLHSAMRYSVLDGGKRVRPALVYLTGAALGVPAERLDGPACAVELIHAYSLVHDDLPAMDDDDLRRGKPTCHKAYDEATAILTGDALQSLAFQVLAEDPAMVPDTSLRLRMVALLAECSGSRGMAGGQAIDTANAGKALDLPALQNMHSYKTGALIRASVGLGALSATDIDTAQLGRLDHYARAIGLAFQIRDDILDVEGDTATLGKPQGADQALNKPTYPALLGLEGAKQKAREACDEAIASLDNLGPAADPLRWLAEYIVARAN